MSARVPAGLADPVHDAQQAFRIALDAMARPGTIHPLGRPLPGLALGPALAALLLTLADEDTPVWWQQEDPVPPRWLRFHTGARSVTGTQQASFAAVTVAARLPELASFRTGTLAAPDQSCTLLVEVPSLRAGQPLDAFGPGIREAATLRIAGLPEGFWAEWQASRAAFPQGLDIFFTCGQDVLALPRTTRVGPREEA